MSNKLRYTCYIFILIGINIHGIAEGADGALRKGIELFNSSNYASAKVIVFPIAKKADPVASYMMGIISSKESNLNSTIYWLQISADKG